MCVLVDSSAKVPTLSRLAAIDENPNLKTVSLLIAGTKVIVVLLDESIPKFAIVIKKSPGIISGTGSLTPSVDTTLIRSPNLR